MAPEQWAEALSVLKAPLGVHAILGNHDWWDDLAAQRSRRGPVVGRRVLERFGIPVYENDAVRLEKDGHAFWLAGLGDQLAFKRRRRRHRQGRKGVDEDFGRGSYEYSKWLGDKYVSPSSTLGAIEQGPFYAAQAVPGDVGTYGGVVTDADARVLREDGSVIEGLYATGISTASVMGRFYPGAGSSVGPSFVFGYIAAKHAANAGNMA